MSSTETSGDLVVIHPLDPEDASAIDRIRAAVRAQKGVRWRIEARQSYILHFHGGWFHAGSATAYRHLVGHN
jgi:hypothetical protein